MTSTTGADSVGALLRDLGTPRAAFAYGVPMRELSHNWFLHTLLRLPSGPALVHEMAKSIAPAASSGQDVWNCLASGVPKDIACSMNRSGGAGRPDETVTCVMASGRSVRVVIEMKTESPADEAQLSAYVDAERTRSDSVAGLLLRIPGKDHVSMSQHSSMTGLQYSACLEAVVESYDLEPSTRWLVDDYCRTLRFLDRLDTAIMELGNELWSSLESAHADGPVKLWYQDHWRWMQQRLVREVQVRTSGIARWASTPGSVSSDSNGWFIDYWPDPREPLTLGSPEAGASCFTKWRQGIGLEIHVLVQNYHFLGQDRATPDSLNAMDRLWSAGSEILPSLWSQDGKAGRKRPGASRMVGRLAANTKDVSAIAELLQKELPRVYEAMASVVAKLDDE